MAGDVLTLVLAAPAGDPRAAGVELADWLARLFSSGRCARVETSIRVDDAVLRALTTRAGLRQEGLRRQPDGLDLLLLARLAGDVDPADDLLPTISAGMPRILRAAGWFLSDPDGRVLLVDPVYKPGFDIPGGVCDPDEDLITTAHRELAEELGLQLPRGDLLVLDFCRDNGRRGDIELAVFDGGVHPADLVQRLQFPDGELSGAVWRHPDELDGLGPPAWVGRLRAIHHARLTGRLPGPTLLLREGEPIT